MRFLTPLIRLALGSLLLILPMLGVASAAAQEQDFEPGSYTSTLSGYTIDVSGPVFAITGATLEHYSTGEGEIVTVESEWVSIEISFFDDADTPDDSLDAYIAGVDGADLEYTVLARGETDKVAYAILSIRYEGIDVLYYMQVTEDVTGNVDLLETILTAKTSFEDDLAAAQAEITVDGIVFLENMPAEDITAAIEGGGVPTASPVADVQPAAPATQLPMDNAGVTLGLGPGFDQTGEPVADGSIQGYMVTHDEATTLVAVGETGMTAEEVLQGFSGSLFSRYLVVEPIDSRVTATTAWSLYRVDAGDGDMVVLAHADTALIPGFEVLVSTEMPIDAVADSINALQAGLSLDGVALLSDINPREIAGLVEQADEPVVDLVDPLDVEGTAAATEEATGRPRDDAKLPGGDGIGNTSEVNSTPDSTGEPGTESDSSWQGPVLGHVIEWDAATWYVDLSDFSMVESSEADQYESITLSAEISPTVTLLYLDLYGDNSSTPADYLAYWSSDEFLQHETSSGESWTGELVSSRNRDGRVAVVISYTSSAGEFYLIREAITAEEGTLVLLTLDVPADDVMAAYSAAQGGVSLDGEPVFTVFTPAQIERLIAE